MISCTEFIPAYSELFKFIDERSGRQAVYDYWNFLFQPEKSPLNDYLDEYKGLRGCWEYWSVIHVEEACDATMIYNEDEGYHISCMHSCPSKGRFLKLTYMTPFEEYCHHCDGYEYSLEKHGLIQYNDFRGDEKACCRTLIINPRVFQGDPRKMVDELYACEMKGCTAETIGCPFCRGNSLKLTTSPDNLKYMHRNFHVSMDRGAEYVLEKYGESGLRDYLAQFTKAFHVPTIENIREHGLPALKEYFLWLYETEEAPDALSFQETEKELEVKISYCPAIRYFESIGYVPGKAFAACTSVVYEILAEAGGIGFRMGSYDERTGACNFKFFVPEKQEKRSAYGKQNETQYVR